MKFLIKLFLFCFTCNSFAQTNWNELVLAAEKGNLEEVKFLIEDKGVFVDSENFFPWNYTALNRAVSNLDVSMVSYLLQKGANPNHIYKYYENIKGQEFFPLLDITSGTTNPGKRLVIVKLLMDAGGDVVWASSWNNESALSSSVRSGDFEIFSLIVKKVKRLNVKNGSWPLCLAVLKKREKMISVLVEYGAKISSKNKKESGCNL